MNDKIIFDSGVMLRLGKTEEIEKQFNEGYLRFSCPANWINYARHDSSGVSDIYEGVFAHVRKNDRRLISPEACGLTKEEYDSLWVEEGTGDTLFLRYLFSTTVPTICFYSIPVKKIAQGLGLKGNTPYGFTESLTPYFNAMGLDTEDSSVLVIRFPWLLVEELRREIPKAIENYPYIIKSYLKEDDPLVIRYVDYNLDINELFWDFNPYLELFRKRPEYKEQREARIIIPGISFGIHPIKNPDLYFANQLIVPVPSIKDYAIVVPAKNCNAMRFENFNEGLDRYEIVFGTINS